MNLNTSLKVICEAIFSNPATATQFGTADANINRSQFATLTNGVAINQVDKAYSETPTLAASASRTLDLTALTDIFAAALAFVRIKAILIFADAGNVNTVNVFKYGATEFVGPLVLGGISADTPTLTLDVPPGGLLALLAPTAAGWPVSTTTDFTIANGGGGTGVTYDVLLLGGAS